MPPSTTMQGAEARGLARPLIGLFAAGAVAVGLSGLVAEAMGRAWGAGFVSGDAPGTRYTAQRCADFEEYFPRDGCLAAAAEHHWGEVVQYRVVMGVLGLLALVVYMGLRRSSAAGRGAGTSGVTAGSVPGWAAPAVAAVLFAVAAVGLGTRSWAAAEAGGLGVGAPLSGALVSAVAATACSVVAVLARRRP